MAQDPKQHYKLALFIGLLVTGIVVAMIPTVVEENYQQFAAQVRESELDASVGFAPPGYFTDAHITVNNQVTATITLVETNTILFSQSFPAGTFDIQRIVILNGGNIFLTVKPQNNVFTQMSVYARIFHEVVTYQYTWIGIGVLALAGSLGLAILFPDTALGRLAGRRSPRQEQNSTKSPEPD